MATRNGHAPGELIPVHSRFVRVTHWLNAIAILVMIGSGWRIYNNVPIFHWLTFPVWATLGGDPEIYLQAQQRRRLLERAPVAFRVHVAVLRQWRRRAERGDVERAAAAEMAAHQRG